MEAFPVYYVGESDSPTKGEGHFVATFTSFKSMGLGKKCRGEAFWHQEPL